MFSGRSNSSKFLALGQGLPTSHAWSTETTEKDVCPQAQTHYTTRVHPEPLQIAKLSVQGVYECREGQDSGYFQGLSAYQLERLRGYHDNKHVGAARNEAASLVKDDTGSLILADLYKVIMASRMAMVATASLLVCSLIVSTLEASSVWQTGEGDAVAAHAYEGRGIANVRRLQRQLKIFGPRPRLAYFSRVVNGDGGKRLVPSGPNPQQHDRALAKAEHYYMKLTYSSSNKHHYKNRNMSSMYA
ncbi:hypothetical protein EJB05_42117, partial [Eragrostis curvula]